MVPRVYGSLYSHKRENGCYLFQIQFKVGEMEFLGSAELGSARLGSAPSLLGGGVRILVDVEGAKR